MSGIAGIPRVDFATSNGLRLQYLDWGGRGEALILLHGLGDNPFVFAALAPLLTKQFRVVAYARRGHGLSEAKPPYDTNTLTEDLRGLMDSVGFERATLVGWSMGGNEITAMAVQHPERVSRLVYLDAGYDYADPDFRGAVEELPDVLRRVPAEALSSWTSYRAYVRDSEYRSLEDPRLIDDYLRDLTAVEADGRVRMRMPPELEQLLFGSLWSNSSREYRSIRCPTLAIYSQKAFDANPTNRERYAAAQKWEREWWSPFREKSIKRIQTELANVTVLRMAGAHSNFFLCSRDRVAREIIRFSDRRA